MKTFSTGSSFLCALFDGPLHLYIYIGSLTLYRWGLPSDRWLTQKVDPVLFKKVEKNRVPVFLSFSTKLAQNRVPTWDPRE